MADHVARAALERALDDKEQLVLLYQPIHEARTRRIYAAEALLRQRRESGELREAAIIHATAEESRGYELFALDHYLVKKAYADAATWAVRDHEPIRLNINLSPREFQEGNVLERLTELISTCGIDTRRINVEITETSYIEHPEETMHVLAEIRGLGVSLWLDDFGTGHSALTHLQHFPVDGLKIPGGFVRTLPDDARCRAIVRATVAMAHELGLAVIAEEVERHDQLDFLLDLGCEYIQGFLFSKPLEPEAFARLTELDARAATEAER